MKYSVYCVTRLGEGKQYIINKGDLENTLIKLLDEKYIIIDIAYHA